MKSNKHLPKFLPDSGTLREIAVRVDADPRSVRKLLEGGVVRGMVGRRIQKELIALELLSEAEKE